MKDLLLRIRSEILTTNIQRVRDTVENLKAADRYGELSASSSKIGSEIAATNRLVKDIEAYSQDYKRIIPPELNDKLQNLFETFERAASGFRKLNEKLEDLASKVNRNGIPMRPEQHQTPDECIQEIKTNLASLDLIQPDRASAWKSYQKTYSHVRQLFSEYLEFMGGWAIRDAGFDRGTCDLADEFIRSYVIFELGSNVQPLSIPARQESIRLTRARVVRIGFPEWTLWAMPLTAFEIWFAVARESLEITLKQKDSNWQELDLGDEPMWEYLAEAFAVWLTGPGYAYAAFFLRLDPSMAYETANGHVADGMRAYAILKMWSLMDGEDPENSPYKSRIDDLRREWETAVEFLAPAGALDRQLQGKLDAMIPILFNKLKRFAFPGFSLKRWKEIQDWPSAILKGDRINASGADFRDVLNAAWLARIEAPDRYEDIAKRGKELWDEILGQRGGAAPSMAAGRISRVETGGKEGYR